MSKGRAWTLFAVVCFIFSTTWLAIRIGLEDFRPLGSAGLRFLVAFPILLLYARAKHLAWPRTARDWGIPLLLASTMFAVPYALVYYAGLTVPSGLSAALFASHAVFVALLAHFVLHDEPLTLARVAGILLAFAGVIVVFVDRWSGRQGGLGEAAMLGSAALQAVSSVIVRRTQKGVHPVILTCIGCGVGAVVLLAASFLVEGGPMIRLGARGVGAILYLAILGTVVAFSLTIRLIHELGSNRMAMSVYVTPVAALVFGHLLLGESLAPRLLAGAALVVGGVWLASRVDLRTGRVAAPAAAAPGEG